MGLKTKIEHLLGSNYMNLLVDHQVMPTVYRSADIFILPSLDEGFGISIIEAFCYKLPVILHANKHFLSLTNDASQHVDMTKKGTLSKKLVLILSDEKELSRCRAHNYRRYREHYSWAANKESYLELFNLSGTNHCK
jgi:glycosyltransferase involved in cell wall biosynthesis